jgi:hypothetical protein
MPSFHRGTARLAAVGLAIGLVAACGDDPIAPQSLADPVATTAQLAALDDVFDAEALNSFTALSLNGDISPAAAPQLKALRAAVRASNPLDRSSLLRPYGRRIEEAQVLRQLVPTLANAAIFPPEALGKTFEWNLTNSLYEPTARTGAPTNGIRFILYAIDPFTGLPADPLVEVGYADLMDESTTSTTKLHVRVAGVGGTPVYVDYTVTVSATLTSGRITSTGRVTNGATSPDTLQFAGVVTISATETSATLTQDVSLDVNSQDVHIRSVDRVTLTETSITLRANFRFEHGDEVVTVAAVFDVDEFTGTGTGTVTVRVNGGLFATCTAEFGAGSAAIVCEGADQDGLNADEEVALQAIADAVAKVSEIFAGLFGPAFVLVGA